MSKLNQNQTSFLALLSNLEKDEFKSVYNDTVKSLVAFNTISLSNMRIETDWMTTVLDYNVAHLKAENSGLTVDRVGFLVPAAYKQIVQSPTKEKKRLANILGWVVEILKSANEMSNSIMDGKTSMYGNIPSWHIREDVGMTAINDSLMLRMMNYNIINIFFGYDDKLKNKLQDSFRAMHENSSFGRLTLELMRKSSNFKGYTMENYMAVVRYQTAYHSYYFPIAMSLILASQDESVDMFAIKRIMLRFGCLRQLEQDFKDVFENREIKRFSWFYVRALEILRTTGDFSLGVLGADVLECEVVLQVYKELELSEEFEKERCRLKKIICKEIKSLEGLDDSSISHFLRKLIN